MTSFHLQNLNNELFLFSAYEAEESTRGFGHQYKALPMVLANGTVMWWPPIRIKAYCQLDMSNFPFDEQSCWLAFGPWSHDSTDVRSVTSIHLHLHGLIFTARKRSLGQGNIFAPVCHSVHRVGEGG